jgi:hypothetical protein
MMKHVGGLWKALSIADRQAYLKIADKDKVRYLKEMKEFFRKVALLN